MTKSKGSRAERELLHMLFNHGFSVVRSAGSGSIPLPSADIIAANGKKCFAIECKSVGKERKDIPKFRIDELKTFSERFGATAILAIKFDYKGWYFLKLDHLGKTPSGNFFIDLDLADKKGLKFEELFS